MNQKDDLEIGKTLIVPELQHIGMVAPDASALVDALRKTLGISEFTEKTRSYTRGWYRGRPEDLELKAYFGNAGSTTFEVIDPVRGRTPYHDFFESNGKGLHHLAYNVDGLDQWIRAYGNMGLEPIFSGERPGARFAYFDNGYFIIEMVEVQS